MICRVRDSPIVESLAQLQDYASHVTLGYLAFVKIVSATVGDDRKH